MSNTMSDTTTQQRTFTVTAQRGSGDVWVLECAEAGAVSQTKRLNNAADEMREAIAYQSGIAADEVNIVVETILPERLEEMLRHSGEVREQADQLARQATQEKTALVLEMHRTGFSMREIGDVIGVSHQRVAAIIKGAPELV